MSLLQKCTQKQAAMKRCLHMIFDPLRWRNCQVHSTDDDRANVRIQVLVLVHSPSVGNVRWECPLGINESTSESR